MDREAHGDNLSLLAEAVYIEAQASQELSNYLSGISATKMTTQKAEAAETL